MQVLADSSALAEQMEQRPCPTPFETIYRKPSPPSSLLNHTFPIGVSLWLLISAGGADLALTEANILDPENPEAWGRLALVALRCEQRSLIVMSQMFETSGF